MNGESVSGDEDLDLGHDFGQGSDFRVISQKSYVFYSLPPPKKHIRGCFFNLFTNT
jgi:hypothetical protein